MGNHTLTVCITRMEYRTGYKNEYVKSGRRPGYVTLTLEEVPNNGSEFSWRLGEDEAREYHVGQTLTVSLTDNGAEVSADEDTHVHLHINGREVSYFDVTGLISYEYVTTYALGRPIQGASVVFHNGPDERREGSLLPGQSVRTVDGIVFDVALTGNA